MIVEGLLTKFLKRQYANILRLTDFEYVPPPSPHGDTKYLLYVHIPFCEELCPYCSFNRFPLDKDLAREYFKASSTRNPHVRRDSVSISHPYTLEEEPLRCCRGRSAASLRTCKKDFG